MNVNFVGHANEEKAPLIVLSTSKGIMVIPVQQIIRIQSISNYSKLFFKDACPAAGGGKTLLVAKVLRWFQEQACFISFVRIHRTHLVNINYIQNYNDGKTCLLILNNGERFSVARRKKTVVTEQVKNLIRSSSEESLCFSKFNTKKIMAA
jgi:two-component system, LytTR family, response regulator